MIVRTEAIILRTQNYQDSSLIAQVLTPTGVHSLLAKGQRSAKPARRLPLWPLAVVEAVYYEKDGRSLQTLTDCALAQPLPTLMTHPAKMLYGTVAAELCSSALRHGDDNAEAYHVLRDYLHDLDARGSAFYGPFLLFVLDLSRAVGILPANTLGNKPTKAFRLNIREGQFEALPQGYATDPADTLLLCLAYRAVPPPPTDAAIRRRALERLLQHFAMHLEGFRPPQSLQVFSEVFAAE